MYVGAGLASYSAAGDVVLAVVIVKAASVECSGI